MPASQVPVGRHETYQVSRCTFHSLVSTYLKPWESPSAGACLAWCAVLMLSTPTHTAAAHAITVQHVPKNAYGIIYVRQVMFVLSHAAVGHALNFCAHGGLALCWLMV